jgi:cytochrome oxidase Cu insertion factor (SCO1/SenC/PrrC family)
MSARRRWIVPVVMGVLVLAALAFAIVATTDSNSGSNTAPGTSATGTTATAPVSRGGFEGAELPRLLPAPPIALSDQYGRAVSLASMRGKPVVIAFLYAHCGGPCTLIAQQIRGALDELHEPVPVLIVSADPAGDTPAAVRSFLAATSLSGRVYYLTGSPAALRSVWRSYRVKPAAAGKAAFATRLTVFLIDPQGRERVLYGPEQLTPEALAHDVGKSTGSPSAP